MVSLLSDPITIKYLPYGKNILSSLIGQSINEDAYSYAWKFVAHHCENRSSHIPVIYFYQSYSLVAHDESFRINISIAAMHRLASMVLDVSNSLHNTNFPIDEIVCAIPPPYYMD